jgi:phosphatidylglycerol---prolipoprotein diacylglyceryl transferase
MDYYIEFPELGIRLGVSPVAFRIFGQEIYFYGIMIALGFALGLILAFRSAEKYNISKSTFSDLIIIGTPCAIIASRIYYVIFEWDSYKNDLMQVFNLRNGGLAIYGAVIGAAVSVTIYSRIKKIRILKYLDFVAPYFIMAQGIGRFGNFFNQEAFGTNTDLPWGMTGNIIVQELTKLSSNGFNVTPYSNVHPTFLYEFIWNMLVFGTLLFIRKKSNKDGRTVFAYMSLYGFGRMFIESLRTDSLMLGSLRINQVLALALFFIFGLLFLMTFRKKKDKLSRSEIIMEQAGEDSSYSEIAKKIKEEEGKEKESGE